MWIYCIINHEADMARRAKSKDALNNEQLCELLGVTEEEYAYIIYSLQQIGTCGINPPHPSVTKQYTQMPTKYLHKFLNGKKPKRRKEK